MDGKIIDYEKFRKKLIANPQTLYKICKMSGIDTTYYSNPNANNFVVGRVISTSKNDGFTVICSINDDDLSEQEKMLHYANLADKCIKMLREHNEKGNKK